MIGYLLQHYLEESVGLYPLKTAVVSGDQCISYSALWEKSGRLANQLIGCGLKPRMPVGIFLHKSIEAIIAQLAVLRAGCMYIPLDSSYSPLSRIKNIFQASETAYLVSDRRQWRALVSSLSETERPLVRGIKVILADNLLEQTYTDVSVLPSTDKADVTFCDLSLRATVSAERSVTDDDVAYILYTSGSTGVPKGVMITHRNARTFIDWALSCFKPGPKDVFSNIAPLHFDLSVFDVYVALACGACVKLAPQNTGTHPRALLAWIRESGITIFYSVPTVWVSILSYADLSQGDVPALSRILFAGEVFPPSHLKTLMELVPHAEYYNLYGPTETNVCTYYRIEKENDYEDISVPIGSACGNTEIIVLKDDDTLARVGECGELLVKGSIVTKGYYKNPGSTEAAFRKSPLPYHHGAFFYMTGDIVRVVEPGCYAYVGRKDLMIKCSGFRIELQEVERALVSHPTVSEAVVVPVYGDNGTSPQSIAAFITIRNGLPVKVLAIKEYLAGILPRYMIPESVTVLEEIPRNANGKADRCRLTEEARVRMPAA